MNFIQYYDTVLGKRRICQDLSEQTAVGHVLHRRVLVQTCVSALTYNSTWRKWVIVCVSPVRCSHQSVLGIQPLFPECTSAPETPSGPPWWQPPGGAGWPQLYHVYKILSRQITHNESHIYTGAVVFTRQQKLSQVFTNIFVFIFIVKWQLTCFIQVLRKLCGFPASCFTGD